METERNEIDVSPGPYESPTVAFAEETDWNSDVFPGRNIVRSKKAIFPDIMHHAIYGGYRKIWRVGWHFAQLFEFDDNQYGLWLTYQLTAWNYQAPTKYEAAGGRWHLIADRKSEFDISGPNLDFFLFNFGCREQSTKFYKDVISGTPYTFDQLTHIRWSHSDYKVSAC